MPIVEVHSPADMIVSLEGPQPVRIYPAIPAEINVYLFDTVAFKGFDGKSCYEYAVEGGYKGTEAEFTACMNKWLNEVCQADPVFTPHSAYFGFSIAETISDATIGTLTHDPANTLAAREWPVTNSQSPTSLYAHIVVPATVASYINTVGIKGGLPGIWGQAPVNIGGQPYIDIRSPYKFADASLTLVTTSKSGSISAMTWVTTNGQTILAHIANSAIHLYMSDRIKLDNLSGVNTGDQDLSGLEPKRGVDDLYVSKAEKGRLDRLLVDFTVPADTPSLTFDRDKNGVLFSTLGIKRVVMSGKLITDILGAGGSERLSINGDNSNTYASAASSSVLGGYRFPVYKLTGFEAILSITNGGCILSGSVQASQTLVITNTNVLTNVSLAGIKDGATTINSIKLERHNNTFNFLAGTVIKIYRND